MMKFRYVINVWTYLNVHILYHLYVQPADCILQDSPNDKSNQQEQIWSMAREFGDMHGVKAWSLHYQEKADTPWKYFYLEVVKTAADIGYFGFNEISTTNYSKWIGSSQELTLNLYVSDNLKKLNPMLNEESLTLSRSYHNRQTKDNTTSNIWLIKMPNNSINDSDTDTLDTKPFRYNTFTFGYTYHKNGVIEIYDIYRIDTHSKVIINKCGTWNPSSGLQIANPNIWSRRASLNGRHIRAVAAQWAPEVTYIEDNCSSKDCFKGTCAELWHALSKEMNFTYTIRRYVPFWVIYFVQYVEACNTTDNYNMIVNVKLFKVLNRHNSML